MARSHHHMLAQTHFTKFSPIESSLGRRTGSFEIYFRLRAMACDTNKQPVRDIDSHKMFSYILQTHCKKHILVPEVKCLPAN